MQGSQAHSVADVGWTVAQGQPGGGQPDLGTLSCHHRGVEYLPQPYSTPQQSLPSGPPCFFLSFSSRGRAALVMATTGSWVFSLCAHGLHRPWSIVLCTECLCQESLLVQLISGSSDEDSDATTCTQHILSQHRDGAKKIRILVVWVLFMLHPPLSPKIWGCWQWKLKWWWWERRRLLGSVKIKIVGEKHDLIKHKTWRTQARVAIRDDKAATVDFRVGFGFLGNPCREIQSVT